jgi:hypothetical protein
VFWPIIFLVCSIALLGSIIGRLFKGYRIRANRLLVASFVGMVLSALFGIIQKDFEARQKGFLDASDLNAAKQAGINDPAFWKTHRERLEKEAQEAKAAEERAKSEETKAQAERVKAEQQKAQEQASARAQTSLP